MANRTLQAQARNSHGEELTVHAQDTDAPVLPVVHLEHLHNFRPDLVDFVIQQTEAEAQHRRRRERKRDLFVFIERIIGQLSAVVLAMLGIGGGIYAGVLGMQSVAIAIVSATIGTLAVAFVTHNVLRKQK